MRMSSVTVTTMMTRVKRRKRRHEHGDWWLAVPWISTTTTAAVADQWLVCIAKCMVDGNGRKWKNVAKTLSARKWRWWKMNSTDGVIGGLVPAGFTMTTQRKVGDDEEWILCRKRQKAQEGTSRRTKIAWKSRDDSSRSTFMFMISQRRRLRQDAREWFWFWFRFWSCLVPSVCLQSSIFSVRLSLSLSHCVSDRNVHISSSRRAVPDAVHSLRFVTTETRIFNNSAMKNCTPQEYFTGFMVFYLDKHSFRQSDIQRSRKNHHDRCCRTQTWQTQPTNRQNSKFATIYIYVASTHSKRNGDCCSCFHEGLLRQSRLIPELKLPIYFRWKLFDFWYSLVSIY